MYSAAPIVTVFTPSRFGIVVAHLTYGDDFGSRVLSLPSPSQWGISPIRSPVTCTPNRLVPLTSLLTLAPPSLSPTGEASMDNGGKSSIFSAAFSPICNPRAGRRVRPPVKLSTRSARPSAFGIPRSLKPTMTPRQTQLKHLPQPLPFTSLTTKSILNATIASPIKISNWKLS
ncbi:hypothetical protein PCASD_09484 [Puccinia coronata f. sp. avenae]|uniref:Uncharacterized protein n=1 Tax=Puccinia coronata f. sp. avenae TaxID=200324 RepID=A0A2N5UKN5_9BASI|nr:hypothetical protein PCASD_09484 [Puccinia coronata f. sp. avenae]